MTKIKTLIVRFSNTLDRQEIPLFRGAVIAEIGKDKDVLLHNHTEDGFRYAYPEIQYKLIDGKAAVVAMNQGVNAVEGLTCKDEIPVALGTRLLTLTVVSSNMEKIELNFIPEMKKYAIQSWLPLNQNNYKVYTECNNMIERIEMLQRTLTGNIISMAKGVDIHLDERIKLSMTDISEQRPVMFKRQRMMSFNAVFDVNMNLPSYIGLGKGVSLGFGTIKELQ